MNEAGPVREAGRKPRAPTESTEWHEAIKHLPKVVRAGIDDQSDQLGVVVYQWVHGNHLEEKSLSEGDAATIGRRLATVLEFLSDLGIVHRDIKPRNVVMRSRPSGEPVLIDFGLARAVEELDRGSDSLAVSEFLPPEVAREGRQAWSTRGDVYSLGKTLAACLKAEPSLKEFRELLARMNDFSPSVRPLPKEMKQAFAGLEDRLKVKANEGAVRDELATLLGDAPPAIHRAAKDRFTDLWARKQGVGMDREKSLAALADLIEEITGHLVQQDQALAAEFGRARAQTWLLKLREAGHPPSLAQGSAGKETAAVGYLRNAHAHASNFVQNVERAYRELGKRRPMSQAQRDQDPTLQQAIERTARRLDRQFDVGYVEKLAGFWLRG